MDDIFVLVTEDALFESNFFDEIDRWRTANEIHSHQKFKNTRLTDDEYIKISGYIDTMRTTEDYAEYKKAFDKFCHFCHAMPRGVIIRNYELKRGKENRNTLYVEYAYNTKKITLPEDTILYHMSKVDGITELNPYFRGKAAKGYLYDKPRVYFTIRKNMPKFLADYKWNEKLNIYVCKEKIQQAYVDPLVWTNFQGALYVETDKPIKVEKLDKTNIKTYWNKITSKAVTESFGIFESVRFI